MPEPEKRRQFHGHFSLVLFITIIASALLYVVYGWLGAEYYLPISFLILALSGIIAYIILNKTIKIS